LICQNNIDILSIVYELRARLVEIFGSQADVARAFRSTARRNNWVKSGYVPARWAMEVEHVTEGKIAAVEVLNRGARKKPVKGQIASRRSSVRVASFGKGSH